MIILRGSLQTEQNQMRAKSVGYGYGSGYGSGYGDGYGYGYGNDLDGNDGDSYDTDYAPQRPS